jgi:broad specificity phosphatase PhoE
MPIWVGTDTSGKQVDMKILGSREEIFQASKDSGILNKLLFIRHREAVKNVLKVNECSNNPQLNKLTEKGQEEAKKLTEMLKNEKIDMIFSSPMNRCLETIRETAELHNIEVVIDERLNETNTGKDDGKPYIK